ncbi:MAG: class I SAM-dependent methyltransferase [Spirochaetaceae bacterium]|nr:class I SAM-dependent methyltransferase [Spirochaetaceae bacterium]
MEYFSNIIEYYDELLPIQEDQGAFFTKRAMMYEQPCKLLRIGCGTATFEHTLAKLGYDVTGIDTSRELLETAFRRKKEPSSIRFFQMSTLEITHFLKQGFYNVISCLNDNMIFIRDKTLMRKFFHDCKKLLVPGGTLILQLLNYQRYLVEPAVKLPSRKSIRVTLSRRMWRDDDGMYFIQYDLENGTGRIIPVIQDVEIYPIRKDEIAAFAAEAGFGKTEFFADFTGKPFSPDGSNLVCALTAD